MIEFEYTPHPDTVLDAYIRFRYEQQPAINLSIAEFDRYERKVKADAWDEAITFFEDALYGQPTPLRELNPYREEEK